MSRPRKPFGSSHPGRLPATMMKVLAAEMSDPNRLRKGKQYAHDGSVLDIAIEPGVVTCEVQGSRARPYIAALEVTLGDGMPLRRDVTTHCTCPDADNWNGYACKHAIASMFCFSDELLVDPDLLDLWRGRTDDTDDTDDTGDTDDTDDGDRARSGSHRHLRLVTDSTRARDRRADVERPDPLLDALAAPAGSTLPPIPELEPADPIAPRDRELAAVLRDAIAHARVDWD